MEQLTIYSLEVIKNNQSEKKILNFSELEKGNQEKEQEQVLDFSKLETVKKAGVNDVIKVISTLREIIKIKRRFLYFKLENNSLYNHAWSVFDEEYAEVFRDRITEFDISMKKAYSDLFALLRGSVKSKISVQGRKALYLEEVLDILDDAVDIEFKGIYYSKRCLEKDIKFNDFIKTLEYDEMKKDYEARWRKKESSLYDMYNKLWSYQEYVILNKQKDIMLECAQEVKVNIA